MLPKIFPPIAQNTTAQGDNTVCAPDCPVHARLFQALPNDSPAPCLQDPRAYKETSLPEIRIPPPFLVFLKITGLPFTYPSIVSRQGGATLDGINNLFRPAVIQVLAAFLCPLIKFVFILSEACLGNIPVMFPRMKEIYNLGSFIKLFIRNLPYPGSFTTVSPAEFIPRRIAS